MRKHIRSRRFHTRSSVPARYAERRHILPARLRASKPIRAYGIGLSENDLQFVVTYEEWKDNVRSPRGETLKEFDVLSYEELVDYAKGMAEDTGGYCIISANPENDRVELEIRVSDYENDHDEDAYELDPVVEYVIFKCEVTRCSSLAERLETAVR